MKTHSSQFKVPNISQQIPICPRGSNAPQFPVGFVSAPELKAQTKLGRCRWSGNSASWNITEKV